VGEWLRGELLDQLAMRLPRSEGIRAWFRPEGVAQLIERQRRRQDASREIWSVLQFAIWHRLFIEGGGKPPPVDDDPLHWL
jgi:asparagine synthase (glutamine-hydrolysing)